MMVQLLAEKLSSNECESRGWVVEGLPRTAFEARAMLTKGILPSHVVLLSLTDDEVIHRLTMQQVSQEQNHDHHLTSPIACCPP